jgi:hypothetical protein
MYHLGNYVIILVKLKKFGIETSNKVYQILLLPYWALAQQFTRAYKVQGLEKKNHLFQLLCTLMW